MIATPSPVEPRSTTVFTPDNGKSRLDAPCLCSPGQSLPTCGVLQPIAVGRMSAPLEATSNITPQPRSVIPDQTTTTDIGEDSRPAVNRSLENSECNIPADSQHANRTQSIRDLNDLSSKGKEKAILQEDVAREDTRTSIQAQTFEEFLELLLRGFRQQNIHGNFHSQYGAGSSVQPLINPTSDATHTLLFGHQDDSRSVDRPDGNLN